MNITLLRCLAAAIFVLALVAGGTSQADSRIGVKSTPQTESMTVVKKVGWRKRHGHGHGDLDNYYHKKRYYYHKKRAFIYEMRHKFHESKKAYHKTKYGRDHSHRWYKRKRRHGHYYKRKHRRKHHHHHHHHHKKKHGYHRKPWWPRPPRPHVHLPSYDTYHYKPTLYWGHRYRGQRVYGYYHDYQNPIPYAPYPVYQQYPYYPGVGAGYGYGQGYGHGPKYGGHYGRRYK